VGRFIAARFVNYLPIGIINNSLSAMTKKLYLVRHAKSSWENLSIKDFDRPLNERGMYDAPRMAKRFKEREITIDLMLSSPAHRALSTCHAMASILGYASERIKTDPRLYHASEDYLYTILSQTDNRLAIVMVFGHNPGFTTFANSLLGEHLINIPTCGIVGSTLSIDDWKDMEAGCGRMDFFDFPKKYKRK